MSAQCVQVKLELGHNAHIRDKPTSVGFTHDWSVFVRGPANSNIQHFVDKVVFHLHSSFPKPKRVVKESPYQVSESGYAGFVLPIEVYFKNKEEPKKVCFDYDLFLHLEGPAVNFIRCEKLTFQNPTEDFRRKLLKAGGVGILGADGGTVLGDQPTDSELPAGNASTLKVRPSSEPTTGTKKPKATSSSTSKDGSSRPLAGSKSSKSSTSAVSHGSNPPASSPATSSSSSKERSVSLGKDAKSTSSKPLLSPAMKRPPSPSSSENSMDSKKRKGSSSTSSSSGKKKDKSAPDLKKKPKSDSAKDEDKKNREHAKTGSSVEKSSKDKSKLKSDDSRKTSKEASVKPASRKIDCPADIKSATMVMLTSISEDVKVPPKVSPPLSRDTSPDSSISFSSLHNSGKRGPLGALMAELDDQDDDDELVSPLSSGPSSPPHFSNHDDSPKYAPSPDLSEKSQSPPEPSPQPETLEEMKPCKKSNKSSSKELDKIAYVKSEPPQGVAPMKKEKGIERRGRKPKPKPEPPKLVENVKYEPIPPQQLDIQKPAKTGEKRGRKPKQKKEPEEKALSQSTTMTTKPKQEPPNDVKKPLTIEARKQVEADNSSKQQVKSKEALKSEKASKRSSKPQKTEAEQIGSQQQQQYGSSQKTVPVTKVTSSEFEVGKKSSKTNSSDQRKHADADRPPIKPNKEAVDEKHGSKKTAKGNSETRKQMLCPEPSAVKEQPASESLCKKSSSKSSAPQVELPKNSEDETKERSGSSQRETSGAKRLDRSGKPNQESQQSKGLDYCDSVVDGVKQQVVEISEEYIAELLALQRQIMGLHDRDRLQKIVDVIEKNGMYEISSTTLDFDLFALDKDTIRRIRNCFVSAF